MRVHRFLDSCGERIRRVVWGGALATLVLAAGGLLTAQAQATPVISYPSFASTSGLQLNGSATQVGSALRLTAAENYKSGTAFSRTEIEPSASFETEFELRMHDSNTIGTYGPADGIVFVLQPQSVEELGEVGGDLGFAGISPSLGLEFDIYPFNEGDPQGVDHIGVIENGNTASYLECATEGAVDSPCDKEFKFPIYGETPVWTWVLYNAATHKLLVYAASSATKPAKPASPLLEVAVNLEALLGSQFTFAGFTAGTGAGDAIQEILSWELGTSGPTHTVGQSTQPPAEGKHGSATSVMCNLIIATASDTCTATVGDTDVPAAITPTGQVSFSSASGGVFSLGNTCNLVPTPSSPDVASCSVQFLPPSAASLQPAITATYGGDAHHNGSVGHTFYGAASGLGSAAEIGLTGIYPPSDTTVTVPVTCAFPCSTTGTLMSGPEPGTGPATGAAFAAGEGALAAKAKGKPHGKAKKKAKPVLYGTGSLTLSAPGKGVLTIKLNGRGKAALKHAKGKPVKLVLEVTVRTANGTLVKTEQRTITVRPAPKSLHKGKHGKHGKH